VEQALLTLPEYLGSPTSGASEKSLKIPKGGNQKVNTMSKRKKGDQDKQRSTKYYIEH
jgi:hypothetical protein